MDIASLFSLQGRVALVTGGSKNLGKHIAEGFIAAGCERVYINSRKADACEKTAAELGRSASRCRWMCRRLKTARRSLPLWPNASRSSTFSSTMRCRVG